MKKKRPEKSNIGKVIVLLLLVAGLGIILLLRFLYTDDPAPTTPQPRSMKEIPPSVQVFPSKETETPETAVSNAVALVEEESDAVEHSEQLYVSPENPYTEYTYGIATDMVHTWRYRQSEGADDIARLLEEMKQKDSVLGKLWESIMNTWIYVDTELEVHYDILPDGLAEDDRLCIVVLGYQLKADGSMAPELIGRCETALRCAEAYPNAYVALTGGGTASKDRNATEADAMAEWMIGHGVARDRIIIENTSMTTVQNAKKTCSILTEYYPQITQLAIVSSDYHIPLGTLLFNEAAFLYEYENGVLPYTVVSNAAFAIVNTEERLDIAREAQDLWSLADPQY